MASAPARPTPGRPRSYAALMVTGAAADCERILHPFWGQPVNAVTSLTFVAAGVWLYRRRSDRRPLAVAMAGVGLGSFAFHGPMPGWADWAHDVTLGWLLVVVALTAFERPRYAGPALVLLGVILALAPDLADPLAATATVVIVVGLLGAGHRAALAPLLLLGLAAVVGRLAATGNPWCRPEALLQGHGVWHVVAAVAVAWWGERHDALGPHPGSAG